MSRRILSLDVGMTRLKATVIESTLRSCRVVGFFQQPRELERSLADQIGDFCATYDLRGDTVVSCLSGNLATYRLLALPFTNARQVSQAVPFELEPLLPFQLEDLAIAEQIIQRTESGVSVLALALLKSTLSEHLSALTTAGVEPSRVSLAPLAALPLLVLSGVAGAGVTVFLDIGVQHSSVVLLHDGVVCGLRTIDHGYDKADEGAAFVAALQWTLLAMSDNQDLLPTRFFIYGDDSAEPLLKQKLTQHFAAEVSAVADFLLPAVAEADRAYQATFATCLGMGLREALAGSAFSLNLRCGEFSPRVQRDAIRSEWRHLGRLAAAVVVAAGVAVGMDLYYLNTRYQGLRQEVRRMFIAALPEVQTVVNEKAQLEEAIGELQQRRRLMRGVGGTSPLDILRQLSTALPENVPLDLDEWVFDADAVRVRGSTSSFEAVETIKTAVMSLGIFREVQLKDVKTEAGNQKVAFGLQMFLKQESSPSSITEQTAKAGTL